MKRTKGRKRRLTIAALRRRRKLLAYAFLVFLCLLSGFLILPARQTARRVPAARDGYGRHLLYRPAGYGVTPFRKWPLILFLHGSTERGDEVRDVRRLGLPAALDRGLNIPFLVVSPQLDADESWSPAALKKFLDAVLPGLRVDPQRIYLTGWSLGGFGSWYTAETYPGFFAAVAPVSGGGDPELAYLLRGLPVWAFHGARDGNVSPQESIDMVQALRDAGAKVKFTLYPDLAHDCWAETYGNRDLYKWFLANQRKPQKK